MRYNQPISTDAAQFLRDRLKKSGYGCREIRNGLALEFGDGCDALFVRVARHIDGSPSSESEKIFADFERLNNARTQVLIGLRHWAVEKEVSIQKSRSGYWPVQSGCVSSSIQAGAKLTRLAQGLSPAEALCELLKYGIPSAPDVKKSEELVSYVQPPEMEIEWKSDEEIEPAFGAGMLALDCSVLDDPDFKADTTEEFVKALTPERDNPNLRVIQTVVDRVGRHRFSIELMSKGSGDIQFTDQLDALKLFVRSKRLRKLVNEKGVKGAAEFLVTEFLRIDRSRTRVLNALKSLMASNGFALDSDLDNKFWFGKTHRQFGFSPGRDLTVKLLKHSEVQVLHRWLAETQPFNPLPSTSEIENVINGPVQTIKERSLPVEPLGAGGELPEIASSDVSFFDDLAKAVIERSLRKISSVNRVKFHGEYPLLWWGDPKWYIKGRDTWVSESWWTEYAGKFWKLEKNQLAAVILMLNGDLTPKAEVLQEMRKYESWESEAFDDAAIFYLADELPWQVDLDDEALKFNRCLGSPPPETARVAAMRIKDFLETMSKPSHSESEYSSAIYNATLLDSVSASEWLDKNEIEKIRELCLAWASSQDNFTKLTNDEALVIAVHFGWSEVVDRLENNSAFIPALTQSGFEMAFLTDMSCLISALKPCALAAQMAAFVLSTNVRAYIDERKEQLSKESFKSAGTLSKAAIIKSILKGEESSIAVQQLGAAITWVRCRNAGVM